MIWVWFGAGVSFGKWNGCTSIYQSESHFSLDMLWFKLMCSLDCLSLFLVRCWLIDATVPCKEGVDSDDWMLTLYCLLMLLKKLLALSLLEEPRHVFRWLPLQYCPWMLKAGAINVSICISLTSITFHWGKDLLSCCESSCLGKQAMVAPFVLSNKTVKNLSWFKWRC